MQRILVRVVFSSLERTAHGSMAPLKEEVEKKWEKELNAWALATGEARRNPSCARAGQQNEAELCIVDVIQKREPHGGV